MSDHDASEVDASVSCSTPDVIGKSVEDILGSLLSECLVKFRIYEGQQQSLTTTAVSQGILVKLVCCRLGKLLWGFQKRR